MNDLSTTHPISVDRMSELQLLRLIYIQGEKNMATLADLQAEVAKIKTVEDSAAALIAGISQQLKDALATGATPASIQAVIDELDAQTGPLSSAVAANTPVVPPVQTPPSPPAPTPVPPTPPSGP